MSEDRVPYGDEAKKWERDAQELRALLDAAGLTQAAAGDELEIGERTLRRHLSGTEPVPRTVLYAMRWLVEHKPNQQRWMQVHWKKLGMKVSRNDKFIVDFYGDLVTMRVNGEQLFQMSLKDLIANEFVSIHTSYSSDRFMLPTDMRIHWNELNPDAPVAALRG